MIIASNKGICARIAVLAVIATFGPASVFGELTFLASSGSSLYRGTETGAFQELNYASVGLIRGLHRNPMTGEVLAFVDASGSAPSTVYVVENAFSGMPVLQPHSVLSRLFGGLTQIGGTYYGNSQGSLYTLDLSTPGSPVETFVGSMGLGGLGGLAYDSDAGVLYGASSSTDQLYAIDPATALATPIGASGLGLDLGNLGAEWFDGQLYLAAHNLDFGKFEIGRVSTTDGTWTTYRPITGALTPIATALTIIPEPASLVMLATLTALIGRRWRR